MQPETWRILLVDDDAVDRMAVSRALAGGEISITLDEVSRGQDVFARLPPPGENYDCLMVDCYLPGMSGVELIRELRARGVHTPILAVTGQDDAAVEEALLTAGASDYLPKQDWRPDQLARRLRHVIRVGRAEANYALALATAQRAVQDRDDVMSIVTHDLRSPLNAIRIAADELADATLDPAERKLICAAVQRALKRADRLIEDLLDVSRIEAGRVALTLAPVVTQELLEQARTECALLLREAGLELKLEVEPGAEKVLADSERVLQVLGNLISNAVRYARNTGQVIVSTHPVGDFVAFSVKDFGPGIPADQLPYLFDRFFQARQQHRAGAGLGLAIAKGIVEAHGGTISAHSTLGQGSRFTFLLPRAR